MKTVTAIMLAFTLATCLAPINSICAQLTPEEAHPRIVGWTARE